MGFWTETIIFQTFGNYVYAFGTPYCTYVYKNLRYLLCPLALSMPTYSNFQINGPSAETFKVFVVIFTTIKVAILKKVSPKAPFIRELL